MHNSGKPIIELKRVSKIYRSKKSFLEKAGETIVALNRISLKIAKGEILGLVGESGSGKTTTGRLIVKLEEPDNGKIYLDGEEISEPKGPALSDFRRKVQMIFQDPYQSLNPQLSVFDTVSEPLAIHKIGNLQLRREMVGQSLDFVGLAPSGNFMSLYPHQLSGGQRQRVAIARAMILKPGFVVADEPTSMLDAAISFQIFNILLEMRAKLNVAFLFITHSLAAARYLCDRIAVVYRGHLVETGTAQELIKHPKHPYTKALIDALPKFGRHTGEYFGTLLKNERKTPKGESCPFFTRCKIAIPERCEQEKPVLIDVGNGHLAACFYV